MLFLEKFVAIIPCHCLKNETHNSEIKRHIVGYKGARFIKLFQVHAYDDFKLFLFSKCIHVIPCAVSLC